MDTRDKQLLLAHATHRSREFLLAHPEFKPTFWQNLKYQRLLKKRANGIPLAYLLGKQAFFSLDFIVNKHTLIPRPETEILVEKVLSELKNNQTKILIDVGTGTGCIPISIAKNSPVPLHIFALDISAKALSVAKQNANKHSVKITFLKSNLLENLPAEIWHEQNIFITANLPYLSADEFKTEPTIQSEPKIALVAAKNGDGLMINLLEQIHAQLLPEHTVQIFLEMNPPQIPRVLTAATKLFALESIVIPDLSGLNRVLCLKLLGKQ